MSNQFIFNHYLMLHQARFFKRLQFYKNPLFILNLPYFKNGKFSINILQSFKSKYNICIYMNDLSIIESRIQWVQLHE